MTTDLTVAEVLERSADLIEPEGKWTQVDYAKNIHGREALRREDAFCFCAIGAMSYVCGGEPQGEMQPRQAEDALRAVIGGRSITHWNDAPERTQAQVVAKFREAAALARAHD